MQSLHTLIAEPHTTVDPSVTFSVVFAALIGLTSQHICCQLRSSKIECNYICSKIETLMVWSKTVISLTSPHDVLSSFIVSGLATHIVGLGCDCQTCKSQFVCFSLLISGAENGTFVQSSTEMLMSYLSLHNNKCSGTCCVCVCVCVVSWLVLRS